MKIIDLTLNRNSTKCFVVVENITFVSQYDKGACIHFANEHSIVVKETVEEVKEIIKQSKKIE